MATTAAQAQSSIPLTPTAQASGAVITRGAGIDFVTIGSPGNAPWMGNGTVADRAVGRGNVPYEYRIGRFEVTTAQWVEFFNAAYDRPTNDRFPHLSPPTFWGAVGTTATVPGGRRWRVPAGNEMIPTGGISWRMAAIYCNWLHNDKRTDRAAFLDGAYDVTSFTYTPAGRYRDQQTHHPGARYWIPTWDEAIKASHFDPNRFGPGVPGYWFYNNASNTASPPGPPGAFYEGNAAMANYGWDETIFPANPFAIPLGAYTWVQSPWGLLDTAGATREWTEGAVTAVPGSLFPTDRVAEGSAWAFGGSLEDRVIDAAAEFPSFNAYDFGFRIASSIPSPGIGVLGLLIIARGGVRRRSSHENRVEVHRSDHPPDRRVGADCLPD